MRETRVYSLLLLLFLPRIIFGHPLVKGVGGLGTKPIWVMSSLERMILNQESEPLTSISDNSKELKALIKAAKNEYESFQIGISSIAPCSAFFELTDLLSLNGIINRNNITIYKELSVEIKKSSPAFGNSHPLPKGFYPDALIPLTTNDRSAFIIPYYRTTLEKGINLFWFDVYVPSDVQAGVYEGKILITVHDERAEIKIELTVFDFALPKVPSLKTAFGLNPNKIIEYDRNIDPYITIRKYYDELLKHRLSPFAMPFDARPKTIRSDGNYYPDFSVRYSTGPAVGNLAYYLNSGMNGIELPVWAAHFPGPKIVQQWVSYIKSFYEFCAESGWGDLVFDYSFDEPFLEDYDAIQNWARILHSNSGIKNLVPFNFFYNVNRQGPYPIPDARLLDDGTGRPSVDIWVPKLRNHYEYQQFYSEIAQSSEVWVYQSGVISDSYTPRWLLDFEPIGYRIVPWIGNRFGVRGLLYWGTTTWKKDVWSDPGNHWQGDNVYNGDGYLFYPGKKVGIDGPVASMRLKWVRDGIEDYEYIKLYQSLKGQQSSDRADDQLIEKVGTNWDNWTKEPEVLFAAREKIGQKIIELKRAEPSLTIQDIQSRISESGIIKIYPNPFKSRAVIILKPNIKNRISKICIYDVNGRLLKTFSMNSVISKIIWDGKDSRDRVLGPGIYFILQGKDLVGKLIKY